MYFFSSLDSLAEKNIWKKKQKLKKINMKWIGAGNAALTESEEQQISQYFSLVMYYFEEMDKVSGISSQSDFLDNYYYLYYLMLYEIGCNDNNAIDRDYRFVQYYVVEELMRFELIKKEAAIIYEIIDKEGQDIKHFFKKYRYLRIILYELSKLGGVIMHTDLAEQVIREYFDRYNGQQRSKKRKKREKEGLLGESDV